MATAYTTQRPVDKVAVMNLTEFTMSQDVAPTMVSEATLFSSSSIDRQPSSPLLNLPPPPNPPFTFPARPSSSAPSSLSRASGRRPHSAIEISDRKSTLEVDSQDQRRRSPALPEFSFNPGSTGTTSTHHRPKPLTLPDFSFNPGAAALNAADHLSPALSAASPRSTPTHMGHRRGGSEFVGGKLKSGESITVMSTSPTKSESGFASPSLAPVSGPLGHRRGHSHRRSGAISNHDLSTILQASPNPSSRGSSAPSSPADFSEQNRGFPNLIPRPVDLPSPDSAATPETMEKQESPDQTSQSTPEPSPKPPTRARVGFSDKLEFIPRPLSLVSTDTTSTVRPGHSLSGSISSIASITNSVSNERDQSSLLGSPSSGSKSGSRPSTAGAVLERTSSFRENPQETPSPRRRNSIPVLSDLVQTDTPSPPLATPTKTPRKWSFFGLESFATSASPTKSRPVSSSSSDTATKSATDFALSFDDDAASDDSEDSSHTEEKKRPGKIKKKKRVKSWAGSILKGKSKSRAQKMQARRRSLTPPVPRLAKDEDEDYDMPESSTQSDHFQADVGSNQAASDSEITTPRQSRREEEATFPMIDLDAALGPFNTPSRDPQWDEAQRAGGPQKRQLHSAAGLRGFSGPGMHYHRRAESAPEMPPFEGGRFSIHRFGSSSTMADVFEEDEEEEEKATGKSRTDDSASEVWDTTQSDERDAQESDNSNSTPTQEIDNNLVHPKSHTPSVSSTKQDESCRSSLELHPPERVRREKSSGSLHDETIVEGETCSYPSRRVASEPSESFVPLPRREFNQKESGPPDASSIILPAQPTMPISPYPISHSSSFPSPRSAISYDAHRISTAPSSITDENHFHSLLMGEPGPEVVRLSVEVPSLTSTNSTMTRESGIYPAVRPRNMPFHDQRPASFTSTAFGRRRSSLASLSRLISSAHGERSKLSVEVPFENEAEKKMKASKSKRLTRMMQFWKPKTPAEPDASLRR
ncbi:hypothetical protein F5Y16DRAFT_355752 [Xylariaceae sp. FL0255]|nr:hypothetical protein F5Y16DRAFT_355752 [Xylariaceae sp. FL0255]